MSYCLAVKVSAGLVFASDSRTHAGVDQVSTYSKMHVFDPGGDRFFMVLSAGNLATTQALVHRLRSDIMRKDQRDSLATVDYMFDAAEYVGRTSRKIQNRYEQINEGNEGRFDARFIIGGQIRGQDPQLYLIYPEGNIIEVPDATPFLQIGENKYGKPYSTASLTPTPPWKMPLGAHCYRSTRRCAATLRWAHPWNSPFIQQGRSSWRTG